MHVDLCPIVIGPKFGHLEHGREFMAAALGTGKNGAKLQCLSKKKMAQAPRYVVKLSF